MNSWFPIVVGLGIATLLVLAASWSQKYFFFGDEPIDRRLK